MLPVFVGRLELPPGSEGHVVPTGPRNGASRRPGWVPRGRQNNVHGRNGRNDVARPPGVASNPPAQLPGIQCSATIPYEWLKRRSAMLVLKGIERSTTTWDIFRSLTTYGNIVFIELDESRAIRTARVRFEPPPHSVRFFEQGRCKIQGEVGYWAWIEFPHQGDEDREIRTPTGNSCPEMMELGLSGVSFGLFIEPTVVMIKKRAVATESHTPLKLAIDFTKRTLFVNFPAETPAGPELRNHRVDIKFDNIKKLHRVQDGARTALVITLNNPPVAWKMRSRTLGIFRPDRLIWGENEMWARCTEVSHIADQDLGPICLQEDHQIVDFGRWTTYWLEVETTSAELLLGAKIHLKDWNLEILDGWKLTKTPNRNPELWQLLDNANTCALTASSGNGLISLSGPTPQPLPFDVRYQLEVCISHGVLSEYNIDQRFIDKLVELSQIKVMDFNRGRLVLEYAADQGKRIYDTMGLFKDESALGYLPTTMRLPDHCALMRKITITPTKIYFHTPTVETTNRVIRQFKSVQENFLRIQFTDDIGRIYGSEDDRNDQIFGRAYRVLAKGITMGQVQWKFLAFGNSQVRENGAYFFYDEPETSQGSITCESIRKWMGRFSHITVVAKYAARLGQCFSTTRPLPRISAPHIIKIEDVEKGKYCFTDGVGKISSFLIGMVAEDWNISPPPSAVQFRMGGCKGILVAWPDVTGTEVHIRKSQEKFLAEFNGLEIIKCSQYACATLNRQTITILTCLGVPNQVFIDIMKEQLTNYDAAMSDPGKAADLLSRFVDEGQMTKTIETMVLNGFMDSKEPFVHTLLQLWRSWSIKALKEKARLIVDQGAFVLGGVDETDTLRGYSASTEDLPQIFLQVPDSECETKYRVITGLCLVGRNPSLHPGDIRVVQAVDSPRLRHIKNVVTFPRVGDRDIPSMCSGGDLDGDDYFVIWDQRLLPTEWTHPPMNYSAPSPLEEPNGVTADALKHFQVLFMKHNNLPLIATAHLATADYEGAKHPKCLQLAELHSVAVDYVKTGIPATWSWKMEPRRWPHFMEKSRRRSYQSTSALGQLYDMVQKEVFDVNEGYKLPFDNRILKRYKLPNELLKSARRLKTKYDIAMRRSMGQLEIKTEFEFWTGFVMSKPRIGSSYKMQEKVSQESYTLKKEFRDQCIKEAGGATGAIGRDIEILGPFVAAMYRVTWEEVRIALHEARQPHVLPNGEVGKRRISARSMPLISFPWLFDGILGEIAGGAAAQQRADRLMRFNVSSYRAKRASLAERSEPKPKDDDLDNHEEAMSYTRLTDGQLIHRGEILHLFHHDDDDNEYWGSDEKQDFQEPKKPEELKRDDSVDETDLIDLAEPETENGNDKSHQGATVGYLDDLLEISEAMSESYEPESSDYENSSGGSPNSYSYMSAGQILAPAMALESAKLEDSNKTSLQAPLTLKHPSYARDKIAPGGLGNDTPAKPPSPSSSGSDSFVDLGTGSGTDTTEFEEEKISLDPEAPWERYLRVAKGRDGL